MANIERPLQGGSYIRNKDGSLTRVGGTEEVELGSPDMPAEEPVTDTPAPAETDTSKKRK